jgi:hypothetical protein
MSAWIADKVFNNANDFLKWLDENFGDYITQHINEQHTHHTWKPNHSNYPKYSTLELHKNMRNSHMNSNGWNDIAQHITIGKDGLIVLGRDIRQVPVSAKTHNGTTNLHPFAYEMIGNFDKGNDILEGKQLESAIKISRYFYKKNKPVMFHRELLLYGKVPKTCPGTGVDKKWFMDLVKGNQFEEQVKSVTTLTPPLWDGIEIKKGQIGKLTILKPINLWKRVDEKLEMVRILQPNEIYRVYGFDDQFGGQFNVGGLYVTKMDGYILYETPSKSLLQQSQEFYKNN